MNWLNVHFITNCTLTHTWNTVCVLEQDKYNCFTSYSGEYILQHAVTATMSYHVGQETMIKMTPLKKHLNSYLPVGLTDTGRKCLSKTTREQVASNPMPWTIDASILSVTVCNRTWALTKFGILSCQVAGWCLGRPTTGQTWRGPRAFPPRQGLEWRSRKF